VFVKVFSWDVSPEVTSGVRVRQCACARESESGCAHVLADEEEREREGEN